MRTLVVVVGPIASGKSTLGDALGERFRAAGRQVAVLDLDELVETIGGFVGLSDERFRQAQMVFGRLVGAWLDHGFDVIAQGPFFDHDEDKALLHAIPVGITPRRVLLRATLAVALERVRADPGRVLSSRPDVLKAAREMHEAIGVGPRRLLPRQLAGDCHCLADRADSGPSGRGGSALGHASGTTTVERARRSERVRSPDISP